MTETPVKGSPVVKTMPVSPVGRLIFFSSAATVSPPVRAVSLAIHLAAFGWDRLSVWFLPDPVPPSFHSSASVWPSVAGHWADIFWYQALRP